MRREERALELVERIYAAVIEPEGWITFLKALSEELGGAAILLSLRIPDVQPPTNPYFCVGLDDAYRPAFVKHAVEGLPWGSLDNDVFRGRFGLASEVVSRDSVPESGLYRDYMQPQGLAPEWPICHVISREEGHPLAGMVIFRREGGPPLGDEELVDHHFSIQIRTFDTATGEFLWEDQFNPYWREDEDTEWKTDETVRPEMGFL